jgi:crotonobetainyl-CoA:carnitine CoA-transferase CaiB-like acyl-CoA transferase
VRDIAEVAHDEHLAARGTVVPLKHPEGGILDHLGVIPKLLGTPGVLGGEPPRLGEHTRALLSEAGLGQKALDELLKTKAIRQAEPSVAAAKPAGAQTPKK